MGNEDRHLQDEISLLGKEYTTNIADWLKTIVPGSDIEKILEDKRKAYNVAFVDILKKHNKDTRTVYDKLDVVWEDAAAVGYITRNPGLEEIPILGEKWWKKLQQIEKTWKTYVEWTQGIV